MYLWPRRDVYVCRGSVAVVVVIRCLQMSPQTRPRMDSIFHEKQEGSLCAQHCLNALLQGGYFTAVDLAALARQLDETERATMAEAGMHSDEYHRFLQQPSGNFDDSGYFSIQVIMEALRVWGLVLVPYRSSEQVAMTARNDPTSQQAFICNFRDHWFTVRKLGEQWFNLNSLLTGPELISNTYLAMFLAQLEQDGYSIFLVLGSLPNCEADSLLRLIPAVQPVKPRLLSDNPQSTSVDATKQSSEGEDDEEMRQALAVSRQLVEEEDLALQRALQMSEGDDAQLQDAIALSMQGNATSDQLSSMTATSTSQKASSSHQQAPSPEEVRQKRLAFLSKVEKPAESEPSQQNGEPEPDAEDQMLQKAIKMSLGST